MKSYAYGIYLFDAVLWTGRVEIGIVGRMGNTSIQMCSFPLYVRTRHITCTNISERVSENRQQCTSWAVGRGLEGGRGVEWLWNDLNQKPLWGGYGCGGTRRSIELKRSSQKSGADILA